VAGEALNHPEVELAFNVIAAPAPNPASISLKVCPRDARAVIERQDGPGRNELTGFPREFNAPRGRYRAHFFKEGWGDELRDIGIPGNGVDVDLCGHLSFKIAPGTPSDAVLSLNQQPVSSPIPREMEARPGHYSVTLSEGARVSQLPPFDLAAGEKKDVSLGLATLPPSIVRFELPDSIPQCGTARLRWEVENATRVWIKDDETGMTTDYNNSSGTVDEHPLLTTTYEFGAQGEGGPPVTQHKTVGVPEVKRFGPPECGKIVWSGNVANAGEKITLTGRMGHLESDHQGQLMGSLPWTRVLVTAEDDSVIVTGQPYLTGHAVITLSSQKTGLITAHLWWMHVR